MQTTKSRLKSDNEEKIATKKPYSAPTIVELDGSLTETAVSVADDGFGGSDFAGSAG